MATYHEVKHESKESAPRMHHLELHFGKNRGHKVVHVMHDGGGFRIEPANNPEHYFSKDQGEELLAHLEKHGKITRGEAPESEPDEQSDKTKAAPERTEEEEKGED